MKPLKSIPSAAALLILSQFAEYKKNETLKKELLEYARVLTGHEYTAADVLFWFVSLGEKKPEYDQMAKILAPLIGMGERFKDQVLIEVVKEDLTDPLGMIKTLQAFYEDRLMSSSPANFKKKWQETLDYLTADFDVLFEILKD